MRQYKFRGLTHNNQWVYGLPVRLVNDDEEINGIQIDSLENEDVKPETVGEWAGLKDKNGVDIYEGDIIRSYFSDGKDCLHTVEWDQYNSLFGVRFHSSISSSISSMSQTWVIEYDKEVIGNIHQNPELLKP